VALTITHLLEKNLVTTYDAEKILWALLGSVYLYEVEEGKRSKYEIVDMIEAQRELPLKEFSRMEHVGDFCTSAFCIVLVTLRHARTSESVLSFHVMYYLRDSDSYSR